MPSEPSDTPGADGGPRRTSPLTVLLHLFVVGGAVAGVVADAALSHVVPFFFARGEDGGVAPVLIGVVVLSLSRIVQWWFTTYELGASHIVLSTGILRRERRIVPYDRVQQVTGRRQFLDQVLGLERLTVQTAGTGEGEVHLEALTRAEAERVRSVVEQRRMAAAVDLTPFEALTAGLAAGRRTAVDELAHSPHTPVTWQEVHRLSPAMVLLAAVASPGVWGIGIFGISVALVFGVGLFIGQAPVEWVFGVVALLGLTALTAGQLLIGGVLSRWGMVVDLGLPDVARVRSGLFDRREVRVPRHRVQFVRITAGPLHRRLDLVDVAVHSAQSLEGGGASIEVPMVRRRDLAPFLTALLGEERWADLPPRHLRPRPLAARRRAIVRRCMVLAVLGLVLAVPAGVFGGVDAALAGVVVAAPLTVLGVPWGRRAHERAGFSSDGRMVTLASGVLVHRMDTVPVDRIQSTSTSSSWFARRRGLATIHVDVAGAGAVSLMDVGMVDTVGLSRLALPRAEHVGGPP